MYFEHHVAIGCPPAPGKDPLDGTAHHGGDQLFVARGSELTAADALAVTKDGVEIADLADLFEEMADVQHGDTARAQLPDETEETLHVAALQAAGRLVHEDDSRVACESAANLDDLPVGKREITCAHSGIDLASAEFGQEWSGTLYEVFTAHPW